MAELLGDVYQGDSWNYPGMKDTQILHTNSDVSSDSPTHAKVEEQSSLKRMAPRGLRAAHSPTMAKEATTGGSSTPDGKIGQTDGHLTISNSSNSSACCMPSLATQGGPSYDIRASARTAEPRHHGMASSKTSRTQYSTAAAHHHQMTAQVQLPTRLPDHVVQTLMAKAFEDVDSGRHQHSGLELPQSLSGPSGNDRRPIHQQDSILPAYRAFFPSAEPSSIPSQPQHFNRFQHPLEHILPPELLDLPRPPHAQPAPLADPPHRAQRQHSHTSQEPVHSSFSSFPAQNNPVSEALHQMSSQMRQWPSPAGSSARQAPSFAAAQHHMEGLDITGLKRDHSSFSGPTSHARRSKPEPRRALSFTQGSAASAAALAAAAAASARGVAGRREGNSSQAASGSRLSSPRSRAVHPPETDASLSDSDDASGSNGAAQTKRRKIGKGKRGAARRSGKIVCRNCAATQTPQWRCGPDGPRTLCNACGVRYKKGLPLTGGGGFTNGNS